MPSHGRCATRIASSRRRAGRTRPLPASALRRAPARLAPDRSRSLHVPAPPAQAFAPIRRIGGAAGWYCAALWPLRGAADWVVGGPGLRRGRRDPESCASATRSTSGASRASNPTTCCACARRCGFPAGPGCSSRSSPMRPAPRSPRPRCSTPPGRRARLLVPDLADPPTHLRQHAARDRGGRQRRMRPESTGAVGRSPANRSPEVNSAQLLCSRRSHTSGERGEVRRR